MKKTILCLLALSMMTLPTVSGVRAEKPAGQEAEVKALFDKKCSACHATRKATRQKKSQPEWTETVMRMKNKNGAPVSDEEAKMIIEYLTKNYGK